MMSCCRTAVLSILFLAAVLISASYHAAPTRAARSQPVVTPNLVVVMIDTLRADHLGSYGYGVPTSPHLDSLAKGGMRFSEAGSTASYTRASTASLFTGLYPSVHGAVTYEDSISPDVPTLAELLSEAGYRTVGYYANNNVSEVFGFGRGFDVYEVNRPKTKQYAWHLDRGITEAAVPFLKGPGSSGEPFFLYLHFAAPHAPYAPPKEHQIFLESPLRDLPARFFQRAPQEDRLGRKLPTLERIRNGEFVPDDDDRQQILSLYDGEISFTDAQVGEILATMEAQSLTDNTVIVVVSDHGEEFWDHGGLSHGHSHYRELLHVPLIFAGPGIDTGVVHTPVSLIDVMPTLLDLAGVEVPTHLSGSSLKDVLVRGAQPAITPVFAEGLLRFNEGGFSLGFQRSVQLGDKKLILDGTVIQKALFDLKADPEELHNLLPEDQRGGNGLIRRIARIHHDNLRRETTSATSKVDAELEAELLALGYLRGSSDVETRPVFRRPLRTVDLDPFGLLGYEAETERYTSRVSFTNPEEGMGSAEQLLYGWIVKERVVMMREAGVRLKRREDDGRWRLVGFAVGDEGDPPPSLVVDVLVDGEEVHRRRISQVGQFTVDGPLPPGPRSFARLDLSCDGGALAPKRLPFEKEAHCIIVEAVELYPTASSPDSDDPAGR